MWARLLTTIIYFSFFTSENNRFIDDIILFSQFDNSYITTDRGFEEETIKEIFKDVDTSNGVIVFVLSIDDRELILNRVKDALGMESIELVRHLNACSMYKIS